MDEVASGRGKLRERVVVFVVWAADALSPLRVSGMDPSC